MPYNTNKAVLQVQLTTLGKRNKDKYSSTLVMGLYKNEQIHLVVRVKICEIDFWRRSVAISRTQRVREIMDYAHNDR